VSSMVIDEHSLVVPGPATMVLSKKLLRSHKGRLLSLVSAARTLDLETKTDAEQQLWVRVFGAFVRHIAAAEDARGSHSRGGVNADLAPHMVPHMVPHSDASGRDLRAQPTTSVAGLRFPSLSSTLQVKLGDVHGTWDSWPLELQEGKLTAPGQGVGRAELSLAHVVAATLAGDSRCAEESSLGGLRTAQLVVSLRTSDGALPPLTLSGPIELIREWRSAIETSVALFASAAPPPPASAAALAQLRPENIEKELNALFDGVFTLAASDARSALEALEPLLAACEQQLEQERTGLPPRPDVYGCLADAIHRRHCNVYSVLLVRHDLDRQYLNAAVNLRRGSVHGTELMEPLMMLKMISWNNSFRERMAAVGAGDERTLLTPEACQTLVSAYLNACRQLTRQWATNILFTEQQTMLQRNDTLGEAGEIVGNGILQIADESGTLLYLTELHMDLFTIVHEQLSVAVAARLEELLFNVLLAVADFLADVQNELLRRLRAQWRRLGFLYLCATINNCARCIDLWDEVLERSTTGSMLSAELSEQLHLEYVHDGFVNLARAAVQLGCWRVLLLLERPFAELFTKRPHAPVEMAALVSHFLTLVSDGVVASNAERFCGLCLEYLFCAYGVMLFVHTSPGIPTRQYNTETPARMVRDIAAFEELLSVHGQAHAGAQYVLQILLLLQDILALALDNSVSAVDVAALRQQVENLRALDDGLTRDIFDRLMYKCRWSERRGCAKAELLQQCFGGEIPPATVAHRSFFAGVEHALQMGRQFDLYEWISLRTVS